MYCGKCGKKNEEGAKVCSGCGCSLEMDNQGFVSDIKSKINDKIEKLSKKDGKSYFNAKKYLSYAAYYQLFVIVIYVIFLLIGLVIGFGFLTQSENPLGGLFGFIISIGLAYALAWIATLVLQIKIQDMRWKVDLHNSIVLKNKD